jgi:quercetin dioxygenase-like cupin family protein
MVVRKFGPEPIVLTRRDYAPVRVVTGGNHVTNLLEAGATSHAVDAISVRADAGGGPPPHRHEFGEWFHVLEGSLDNRWRPTSSPNDCS